MELPFDQRHLVAMYSEGVINELPYELGTFPIVETSKQVAQDLIDWNIVDPLTRQLTAPAQELFAGVTDYQWALSGVLLLYDERQPVQAVIPEEFETFGLEYAVRDIPRVGFLIGYHDETLTTLTMAGGNITIAADQVRDPSSPSSIDQSIAQIVLNLCDPEKQWQPYPMPEVAIPAETAQALATPRVDDEKELAQQVGATRSALSKAKMSAATMDGLTELMRCHNVASAQIGLTERTPLGKRSAMHNALGLLFFVGSSKRGMVVSYPTRSFDGTGWITYTAATPSTIAKGIAELRRGLTAEGAPLVTV